MALDVSHARFMLGCNVVRYVTGGALVNNFVIIICHNLLWLKNSDSLSPSLTL